MYRVYFVFDSNVEEIFNEAIGEDEALTMMGTAIESIIKNGFACEKVIIKKENKKGLTETIYEVDVSRYRRKPWPVAS